jgi:hypothetical protein
MTRAELLAEMRNLLLTVAAERGPGAAPEDPDCPAVSVTVGKSYLRLEDTLPFLLEALARGVEEAAEAIEQAKVRHPFRSQSWCDLLGSAKALHDRASKLRAQRAIL